MTFVGDVLSSQSLGDQSSWSPAAVTNHFTATRKSGMPSKDRILNAVSQAWCLLLRGRGNDWAGPRRGRVAVIRKTAVGLRDSGVTPGCTPLYNPRRLQGLASFAPAPAVI